MKKSELKEIMKRCLREMKEDDELKEIIKLALVEVLAEGLGVSQTKLTESSAVAKNIRKQVNGPTGVRPQSMPVKSTQNSQAMFLAKGNSEMAKIFADTAVTTLPMMLSQPDPESFKRSLQESMMNDSEQYAMPMQSGVEYPNLAAAPSSQIWDALAFGPQKLAQPIQAQSIPKEILDRKVG